MGMLDGGMMNNAAVLGLIKSVKSIDETAKYNNQHLDEINKKLDKLISILENKT